MNLNRAHILLKDDRRDLRIKENADLPWQIKYKQRHGLAKIRNISASGMMIETDRAFDLKDECIFSFDSDQGENTYIPQVGRLIWHKKKKFSGRYLCGIKFVDADDKVLQRMRLRVARGVREFVRTQRITNTTGLVLCIAIVGLIAYLFIFSSVIYRDITKANEKVLGASRQQAFLAQSVTNLYRANEIKIAEAERRLEIANRLIQEDRAAIHLFSQELEATKALLTQTETMLIAANDRNVEITNQLQSVQAQAHGRAPALAASGIAAAKTEGNIQSLDEARALMAEYRLRLKSLKGEVQRMKTEEYLARAATYDQIDNQKLKLGNNGYIIKNGQVVWVDENQYQNLTTENVSAPAGPAKNVEIDVTFIE